MEMCQLSYVDVSAKLWFGDVVTKLSAIAALTKLSVVTKISATSIGWLSIGDLRCGGYRPRNIYKLLRDSE